MCSVFLEESKAILAAEASAPERQAVVTAGRNSWWAWLRPAIVVPTFALLLAVIAYQNWPAHRDPQVLQAVYVNIGSRGGAVPSVTATPEKGFLLRLSVPPSQSYSAYAADVMGPDGKMRWSLQLPNVAGEDSYFVQVPAGSYNEGVYSVVVRGTNPDGSSTELGRGSFELHIAR